MEKEDIDLGTFEVVKEIVVSDPCYDEIGHLNRQHKAQSGTWKAKIEVSNEGEWGKRVTDLFICHEDFDYLESEIYLWEDFCDCGVDSGQLGVFDKEVYRNDEHEVLDDMKKADICEDEPFYNRMCYLTLGDDRGNNTFGGTFKRGVNVSSGYGDGLYLVRAIKRCDEVVALWVNFIQEDDEDDDY